MSKSKQIVVWLLVVTMVVGLLVGCDGPAQTSEGESSQSTLNTTTKSSETTKAEDRTLKVWAGALTTTAVNDMLEARFMSFEEAGNCVIDFEFLEEVNYHTKLSAALESGDLADVAFAAEMHPFKYYPNIPFMELSEVKDMIEEKTGRKFLPGLLRNIEGTLYNLPFYTGGSAGFFRKSVWATIGIDETNFPTTWDEIADAALQLQATNPGIYAFGVGCGSTDNDSEVNLREWMWSLNGGIFDENGNPDTIKEGNIHVFTRYKELWDAKCIPESALSWDGTGNNTSYLTNEIALMFNNVSYINALRQEGNEAILDDTGIINCPEGPKYGSPGGYGILKDSKNPEIAAECLAYLFEPEWYDELMITSLPTMGPVFAETIEGNSDKFTGLNAIVDKRGQDTSPFGYPAGLTVKGLANGSIVFGSYVFNKNLQSVLIDNVPVEEALANLQSEMESLVN